MLLAMVDAGRTVLLRRLGMELGRVRDSIPLARWVLALWRTGSLWRRMELWQVASYRSAVDAEIQVRGAVAMLRARRWWDGLLTKLSFGDYGDGRSASWPPTRSGGVASCLRRGLGRLEELLVVQHRPGDPYKKRNTPQIRLDRLQSPRKLDEAQATALLSPEPVVESTRAPASPATPRSDGQYRLSTLRTPRPAPPPSTPAASAASTAGTGQYRWSGPRRFGVASARPPAGERAVYQLAEPSAVRWVRVEYVPCAGVAEPCPLSARDRLSFKDFDEPGGAFGQSWIVQRGPDVLIAGGHPGLKAHRCGHPHDRGLPAQPLVELARVSEEPTVQINVRWLCHRLPPFGHGDRPREHRAPPLW